MEERDLNKISEYFGLDHTIFTSKAWEELQKTENEIGPEALLDQIIDKRLWTNAEIAWVLRRLIYYYGKKDALLKEAPVERIFANMVDILRAFFLLFDQHDPDIDDNMRTYICSKLGDATWGVNSRTREYLYIIIARQGIPIICRRYGNNSKLCFMVWGGGLLCQIETEN